MSAVALVPVAPVILPGERELHVQVMLRSAADRRQLGGFARAWSTLTVRPEASCCDLDERFEQDPERPATVCSACIETWAIDYFILATTVGSPAYPGLPEVVRLSNRDLEFALETVDRLELS